jgi:ubiquitin C-terminal hydrolase
MQDSKNCTNHGMTRLINIDGISCYMISITHILFHIEDFVNFFKTKDYIKYIDEDNKNKLLTYQLQQIIMCSVNISDIRIEPIKFKKLINSIDSMWNYTDHQDSQEFYSFLINTIEKECGNKIIYIPKLIKDKNNVTFNEEYLAKKNNIKINQLKLIGLNYIQIVKKDNIKNNVLKLIGLNYIQKSELKDYSPIKNIFIGYLISNIQCDICTCNSSSFESFLTLSISIKINNNTNINSVYSLEECIDNFMLEEQLEDKITCNLCNNKNNSIKQILIWKPPKILVIHIKRFITNVFGVPVGKIINPVVYPVNDFDILDYIHRDSPYRDYNMYDLIGINIHKELGFGNINCGHYVSIIKNMYDNEWYTFDDDNFPDKIDNIKHLQNRNAYLLFYKRHN